MLFGFRFEQTKEREIERGLGRKRDSDTKKFFGFKIHYIYIFV